MKVFLYYLKRISTIKNADRIYAFSEGLIVESGTYGNL